MPTTRCVFFDRDGVANAAPGPGRYVTRPEEFHILPGFLAALRDTGICVFMLSRPFSSAWKTM